MKRPALLVSCVLALVFGDAPPILAQENIGYVRWADPIERAFSLEVPRGWKVGGGAQRGANPFDLRTVVQAVSPDQSVLIQFGDAEIPPFSEPTPMLREGTYNGPALVRRYEPGHVFGRTYIDWRVRKVMPDVAITVARPIPRLQQVIRTFDVKTQVDIGELMFRGTWNGRRSRGYLFVSTQRISQPGVGSMWFTGDVIALKGIMASADQVQTAASVMLHMQQTFRIDPRWFANNYLAIEQYRLIADETNRYLTEVITQSYVRDDDG